MSFLFKVNFEILLLNYQLSEQIQTGSQTGVYAKIILFK